MRIFAIFDTNRHVSRKRYEMGPRLILITHRKSCQSIRVGSDDLELVTLKVRTRVIHFSAKTALCRASRGQLNRNVAAELVFVIVASKKYTRAAG